MFLLFENLESVVDYREFETESSKINYLNSSRRDLIMYNLDYFLRETGERTLGLDKNAQSRIKKFIDYVIENQDKKKEFFTYALKIDRHLKTLIDNENRRYVKQKLSAIRYFILDESGEALNTY